MQAPCFGPLANYNSLEDEYLQTYFSNPYRVKHLRRMGLITKDGKIVSEATIKRNAARKEHRAHSKDLLADSIVQTAVEIERKRRAILKKKLEQLAKIQTVEWIRSQKSHPVGVQEFNPQTLHHPFHCAPAPPPRLSATLDSHSEQLGLSDDQLHEMRKLVSGMNRDKSVRIRVRSPYELGQWSRSSTPSSLAPRPPSAPKPQFSVSSQSRRLQLTHQNGRPWTAPARAGERPLIPRRSRPKRSEVQITLRYIGKNLHLESAHSSDLSEVLVVQQHCGGNTVQLYRGRVKPREQFTFESRRHLTMPFGLSIYLDGMMDARVSTCCEYRHQCGRLLGSKSSHFRLIRVENGNPCPKCNAESERKERKEIMQQSLDDVINSSPSTEIDEELSRLLARNGISGTDHTPTPSQAQDDTVINTWEPENSAFPKPEETIEESKDNQATEEFYEEDFVRDSSEVSLNSRHSSSKSGSKREESPIREEPSRASSHSHSRSSTASSVSSLPSEESTHSLKKSSQLPSESGSISPTSVPSSVSDTANTDTIEEPDVKEELKPSNKELRESNVEENSPESKDSSIHEPARHILDTVEQQASDPTLQSPDPEQNDKGPPPLTSEEDDDSATLPTETTNAQESFVHDDKKDTNHTKSLEQPIVENSMSKLEISVVPENNSAKSSSASEEAITTPNTLTSSASSSLSASLTIKEATKALEKTPSVATSLGSLLNDDGSRAASSVDLSDQDEEIPELEKQIVELSSPNLTVSTNPTPSSKTSKVATPQQGRNFQAESTPQAEGDSSVYTVTQTQLVPESDEKSSNDQLLPSPADSRTDQKEEEQTLITGHQESAVESPKTKGESEMNLVLNSDPARVTEENSVSFTSKEGQEVPDSRNKENSSPPLSQSSSLTSVSSQNTQSS